MLSENKRIYKLEAMNKNHCNKEIMSDVDINDAITQLKFAVRHEEWVTVNDVIEFLEDFLPTKDIEEDD